MCDYGGMYCSINLLLGGPPAVVNLSIIIPVYNSADCLPTLIDRLHPALAAAAETYEVVLVNDGSTDQSWARITELAVDRSWIRPIDLMRNYGQHAALLCGARAAHHDIIITLDDDLQHAPEDIPSLLAALTPETDVVYGVPETPARGHLRRLLTAVTKFVMQEAMGVELAFDVSAFRAFRRSLVPAFANYTGTDISLDVLLSWGTTRFTAVKVPHHPRFAGQSNYTLRKLVRHTINMVTGFSVRPLRFASITGLVFSAVGFLLLGHIMMTFLLYGRAVPGFAFLGSAVTIFGGIELLVLGVVGEYLARVHFRSMGQPPYTIREPVTPEFHSRHEDV